MTKSVKTALIIGGIIVGVLIILPLILGAMSGWSGTGYGMMRPWMMGPTWMMGGFGIMGIWMVLFWGLIIWLVVVLVRRTPERHEGETALEILKRRYARGEISSEEYEAKKKELT